MPDRTQDLKNHRQVAVACKNYTDAEIKKSEGRILSIVARNNVSYIDHTDEATYRFTAPANAKLLMLQSIAGNSVKYSPSVASDNTTAYQKTIPSYSPSIDRASASMNILGGMSYKVNQLVPTKTVNRDYQSIIITSNNDGTYTIVVNNPTGFNQIELVNGSFIAGHKYLNVGNTKVSSSTDIEVYIAGVNVPSGNDYISTVSSNTHYAYLFVGASTPNGTYVIKPQIFDLTADFGSGNEPASVSDCATEYAKRGIDIYSYTPQQSAIRDTAPTSVVSKDSNDTTIDTLTIDSNIQALNGYGWGIDDTCYNYIDFNAKKFIKKMARVDLGSLYVEYSLGSFRIFISNIKQTPSTNIICSPYTITSSQTWDGMSNMEIGKLSSDTQIRIINNSYSTVEAFKTAMSGVYLYYELATPVETDISAYLTTNEIEIEPNGTLSFESTYSAYVPSNVSYNGVIKHALATAVKQEGANRFDINDVYGDTSKFAINGDIVTGIAPYVFTPTYSKRNFTQDEIGKTFKFRVLFTSNCSGSNLRVVKRENGVTSDGNLVNSFPNYSTITVTPTSVNDYIGINFSTANSIQISEVMLNEGNTALSYRPYKAPITRLLPNSEAKYSWGIADGVRNTRVFCDDECNPVNEGQLDVGNQDLGGLNYTYDSDNVFIAQINSLGIKTSNPNCICSKYNYIGQTYQSNLVDKSFIIAIDGLSIRIKDTTYTNATTFKTGMSGEMLWYQKNATGTETLDDFDFSFDCEEGDTFTLVNAEQLQCYATYSFLIKEARTNE